MKILIALAVSVLATYAYGADVPSDAPLFVYGNPYFNGPHALDYKEVVAYFNKLQLAVKSDDVQWLSENITYPLKAGEGKHRLVIHGPADFDSHYKVLFNKTVHDAVACQKLDHLFVNSQGIMVGNGAIWFDLVYLKDLHHRDTGQRVQAASTVEQAAVASAPESDRSVWNYRITAISSDETVGDFVKRCQSGQGDE